MAGGGGGGPPWPRKVRLEPKDGFSGVAPRFADFPPRDAPGLLSALRAVGSAKLFPGRDVSLFFPDGTEVGRVRPRILASGLINFRDD